MRATRENLATPALRLARRCYGHAAGQFGCALCDALLAGEYLVTEERRFAVTPAGRRLFAGWGIDCAVLASRRAAFAPQCLDGSERRPHLGGTLGRAAMEAFALRGWIALVPDSRALRVDERCWQILRAL